MIDDDELIAGSLRRYLVERDCEVDLATEPQAAEALMAQRVYDTVMVDPYLTAGAQPNRLSLLTTVRELQPRADVIVVTAYGTEAIASAVSGGTVSALLLKPRAVAELGRAAMSGTAKQTHPTRRNSGARPAYTKSPPRKGSAE
ncbi:MAG TPA: response regulator [Thermoanaerobaculia bacterium]|nr:response regulator [Thermoanaerobaculia bacterium]